MEADTILSNELEKVIQKKPDIEFICPYCGERYKGRLTCPKRSVFSRVEIIAEVLLGVERGCQFDPAPPGDS